MTKFEVLQKTFIRGVIHQPGEIIELDDNKLTIGDNLRKVVDPAEEAAKAAAEAKAEEEAKAAKAAKAAEAKAAKTAGAESLV